MLIEINSEYFVISKNEISSKYLTQYYDPYYQITKQDFTLTLQIPGTPTSGR